MIIDIYYNNNDDDDNDNEIGLEQMLLSNERLSFSLNESVIDKMKREFDWNIKSLQEKPPPPPE